MSKRNVECRFGVVDEIIDYDKKKAYVIYPPDFFETGQRIAERWFELGYDVYTYNTGNDLDRELAREKYQLCEEDP